MRPLHLCLSLCLLARAVVAQSPTYPAPIKGPVAYSSQSVFGGLFSHASQMPTPVSKAGGLRFALAVDWANMWTEFDDGYPREYLIDYEFVSARLDVRVPLKSGLELGLWADDRTRFGGDLDRFIEGFHRALGLDHENRNRVLRDQVSFEMTPENAPDFILDEPRGRYQSMLGLGMTYRFETAPMGLDDLSLGIEVVGRRVYPDVTTGGEVDVTIGVSGLEDLGNFTLFGSLQTTFSSADRFGPYEVQAVIPAVGLGAEWHFQKRSLIFQALFMDGPLDVVRYSTPSYEIALSLRQSVSERFVFEFGLVDTMFNYTSGPDFGVHFGLVHVR